MELSKGLFTPLPEEEKNAEAIARPTLTYAQDVFRRLKSNKIAMFGFVLVVIITLIAIIAPIFYPHDYYSQNFAIKNQGPSADHWLGTDTFGRDEFARICYGARISLTVAYVASLLNIVIGVLYGGISGYFGGKIDNLMMRIIDVLYSIPMIIYVILLMLYFGNGMSSIIIALAISYWMNMARIVRGEVLALKEQEFVLAARTLGASSSRIIIRHLIPNCIGSIIVTLTLMVPQAIFTEAFLSYLGLGISAPKASWGTLASDAVQTLSLYPSQLIYPSIAICLTILGFNMFGDGLRDALDPKMRK